MCGLVYFQLSSADLVELSHWPSWRLRSAPLPTRLKRLITSQHPSLRSGVNLASLGDHRLPTPNRQYSGSRTDVRQTLKRVQPPATDDRWLLVIYHIHLLFTITHKHLTAQHVKNFGIKIFFGFFKLGVMRECIRVTLFTGHTYSRSEYTLYLVPSIPLKVFYRFISIFWDTTVESFLTYIRVIPISWDSPFTPKETIFFQNSCVESTHSLLYHQWSHPAGPR